jgi:hypothetical protein
MKHIKIYEAFVNESYNVHIGIAKFPDGSYHPFITGNDKSKVNTFGKEGEEFMYQSKGNSRNDFKKMHKFWKELTGTDDYDNWFKSEINKAN